MPTKEQLIKKLTDPAMSRTFDKRDLASLMKKCGCIEGQGGRGSGIFYINPASGRKIIFDLPHPQKELKKYHKRIIIQFLKDIGEIHNEK